MSNRTNYTDFAEWKAAWKTAHPNARNAMSSGSLDYEYCYLPDVDNLNVAGFDHELNKGWVAAAAPSDVQASFFTVEEAREAFRRSLEMAAPKGADSYTYFKMRTNKLTVNRRGKEHVFRKGDPLGWRFSSSGKFLRLISPLTGPNIIFSVEITDQVLKWLDKQDPNAKRKRGQLKSDRPEDGNNRLEGYVVTDGKWYYRLDPKPVRSRKTVPEVIHPKEQSAKQLVRRFPDRKLKVQPVYTKDLGKVLSSVVAAYDVYIDDLPTRDQPAHNEKVKKFLADFDRNLKKNGYTRTGSLKRSAMAEVTYKKGADSVSLNYHHGTGRYGNVKAFLDLLFNDKIVAQAPLYAPSLSELVRSHDEAMKVALRWSQNPIIPE